MEVIIDGKKYVPASEICHDPSVLETRMYVSDLDSEVSLREYLYKLLLTLWVEDEGFSGKRPFGNSGWSLDIYAFLVKAGAINGKFYIEDDGSEGCLDTYDQRAGNTIMPGLIAAAFNLHEKTK